MQQIFNGHLPFSQRHWGLVAIALCKSLRRHTFSLSQEGRQGAEGNPPKFQPMEQFSYCRKIFLQKYKFGAGNPLF